MAILFSMLTQAVLALQIKNAVQEKSTIRNNHKN